MRPCDLYLWLKTNSLISYDNSNVLVNFVCFLVLVCELEAGIEQSDTQMGATRYGRDFVPYCVSKKF